MLAGCAALDATPAAACGGSFFPAVETTVAVTGHQMALSIGRDETVVWDRLEVSGNPSELAWVIPVHEGAKLELSNERWFAALAAVTAPQISATPPGGGGGGGGCSCGSADDGAALESRGAPNGGTQVIERKDIGPYDVAKLRASDPGAIRTWLVEHGFAIPDAIGPVLDQYTSEGFDFLALRVRPGATAASLQPLRLSTPGADPTLPLRMSRAGVKTEAALTLYVLGEGRYRVQGFAEVKVPADQLFYDAAAERSNYDDVVTGLLAGGDGRRFVVEHAQEDGSFLGSEVSTLDAACNADPAPSLGGDDAGSAVPDGPDAAAPIDVVTCARADLVAARRGAPSTLWITRLRARLPESAFDRDLRLEASPAQESVPNTYYVPYRSGTGAMVARARPSAAGSLVIFGATLAGVAAIFRRRRARR